MEKVKEKSPFYTKGLRFSCTLCSDCCRHESGYVFLSEKDASMLGKALNMGHTEFIRTFCRWIPSFNGTEQLSLKEKSNYDCIFWSSGKTPNGGCSVYEARPLQCRSFPFWPSIVKSIDSWEFTAESCPGIGQGSLHSGDSIKKWLALRQKEPIIFRNTKVKGEF